MAPLPLYAAAKYLGVSVAHFRRHLRAEIPCVYLGGALLLEMRERIQAIFLRCTTPDRIPGPHCERCFFCADCPQFLAQSRSLIEYPWNGGGLVSQEQVARGLRALKAAEVVLDTFKERAREWVAQNGPAKDADSGEEWGPVYIRRQRKLSMGADDVRILAGAECCEACAKGETCRDGVCAGRERCHATQMGAQHAQGEEIMNRAARVSEVCAEQAEAHRLAHKLRDPKFYTARTKRAVNSGGVL